MQKAKSEGTTFQAEREEGEQGPTQTEASRASARTEEALGSGQSRVGGGAGGSVASGMRVLWDFIGSAVVGPSPRSSDTFTPWCPYS